MSRASGASAGGGQWCCSGGRDVRGQTRVPLQGGLGGCRCAWPEQKPVTGAGVRCAHARVSGAQWHRASSVSVMLLPLQHDGPVQSPENKPMHGRHVSVVGLRECQGRGSTTHHRGFAGLFVPLLLEATRTELAVDVLWAVAVALRSHIVYLGGLCPCCSSSGGSDSASSRVPFPPALCPE